MSEFEVNMRNPATEGMTVCDANRYRWETDEWLCVWNCPLDNYSRKCLEDRADPLGICCENIVEFRRKPKPASDREAALRAECDKLKVQLNYARKERDEARKIARDLAEFVRVLNIDWLLDE